METEKQFKEIFGKMSHDQLLDYAYKLRTEVETLQEKNSSLKRAMYGRKKENVNIDQLSLFNEAELIDESSKPDEVRMLIFQKIQLQPETWKEQKSQDNQRKGY